MMLYINSSHTQYEAKVIIHMRKGQVNHHKGIAHTAITPAYLQCGFMRISCTACLQCSINKWQTQRSVKMTP